MTGTGRGGGVRLRRRGGRLVTAQRIQDGAAALAVAAVVTLLASIAAGSVPRLWEQVTWLLVLLCWIATATVARRVAARWERAYQEERALYRESREQLYRAYGWDRPEGDK